MVIVRVVKPNCGIDYVEEELRVSASGKWVLFKMRESRPIGEWTKDLSLLAEVLVPPPLSKGNPGRRSDKQINGYIMRRMGDMSEKKMVAYKIIAKEVGLSGGDAVRRRVERMRKNNPQMAENNPGRPTEPKKQDKKELLNLIIRYLEEIGHASADLIALAINRDLSDVTHALVNDRTRFLKSKGSWSLI